jgi:hypothetical protein
MKSNAVDKSIARNIVDVHSISKVDNSASAKETSKIVKVHVHVIAHIKDMALPQCAAC